MRKDVRCREGGISAYSSLKRSSKTALDVIFCVVWRGVNGGDIVFDDCLEGEGGGTVVGPIFKGENRDGWCDSETEKTINSRNPSTSLRREISSSFVIGCHGIIFDR